jgi:nucleotide-binding universal stress UspA family protein
METPADRSTDRPLPVVVGVDGSEGSSRALRWAALEARRTGAALRIITAWQAPVATVYATVGTPYIDPGPLEEAAKAIVRRAEAQVRDDLGDAAPPIAAATVQGPATSVLIDTAAQASLLVVGTRGRGGFASLVLGSVSTTCAHHTPAPLVIVGENAPDPGAAELVVGFDGSAGARAALRWAVEDARLAGTRSGWCTAGRPTSAARSGCGRTGPSSATRPQRSRPRWPPPSPTRTLCRRSRSRWCR